MASTTTRIIHTIKPSSAPDFTKRPVAYPASSGFLNDPRCRYMRKPTAAPHIAPKPQKSRSSFPNSHDGAITFLSCMTTASDLELRSRGRSSIAIRYSVRLDGLLGSLNCAHYLRDFHTGVKFHCM